MIGQFKKFIHEKCTWVLGPWRFCYELYVSCQRWREGIRIREAHRKIDRTISRLKERGGKVSVGFYVYNDAVFQLERVFQRMLDNEGFDPYIVVSWCAVFPNEDRRRNDWQIHKKTLKSLRDRYGADRVWDSMEGGVEVDYSDRFDLCANMRPYDDGMLESCKISSLARKGVPVIYAHYGFEGGDVADEGVFKMSSMGYLWRFYTGSQGMKALFERLHPLSKKRGCVILSGNPKIEMLAFQPRRTRTRKRIIVAPHHTIDPHERFYLSNFVRFANFLVSLPERFPEIDWVFRPHPNLMTKMVTLGFWTENERVDYLKRWQEYKNAQVQSGGPYYEDFVNSDALIQDCSSFLAEYHASGHPQCYMLKSEEHARTQYNGLGWELLNLAYKAFTEQDILDFIENVVVVGRDTMRQERMRYLSGSLLLNFPRVSDVIVGDIESQLRH